MDTNKMREEFIRAYRRLLVTEGLNVQERHFELRDGEFAHRQTAIAWWAWQASRGAVVVELGAPSHWVADYAACGGGMTVFDAEKAAKVTDPMCSKTPSYTIHALEKAGLKVAP
ncbi:hypothetical protein [Pseudomonas sp. NBRC 111126]|uniref:hypothetical protein n=1 Tax=Pseudomonas sp. NBRC 111126 TaxID=1661041 RepID=UPI0008636576|nr:hypothetical protein [Pseudomonas sp. NBRC 111126]